MSGAVTSGITASAGVAFFAMSRLTDALGQWEVFIGGVLLILTAILNPEGVAGGIRTQVAERRRCSRSDRVRLEIRIEQRFQPEFRGDPLASDDAIDLLVEVPDAALLVVDPQPGERR